MQCIAFMGDENQDLSSNCTGMGPSLTHNYVVCNVLYCTRCPINRYCYKSRISSTGIKFYLLRKVQENSTLNFIC